MPGCSNNDALPEVTPSASALAPALEALRRGGLVIYPTETLYGLGADALNPEALARLIALKGREPGKPISVLVSGEEMMSSLVDEVSPLAQALMRELWPGPLTLVLAANEHVSPLLTGGSGTIGVRLSSCALATELVRQLGRPVTTPSANPAGAAPPRQLAVARQYFGESVDCYIDGGDLPGEPPSTVLAIVGERWDVLRHGAVPTEELIRICDNPRGL